MVFAVVISLLATIAVARGLKYIGSHHRAYKNDSGQWADHRKLRAERALALGILIAIAGLMGFRVGNDIIEAGMSLAVAIVVGIVLGAATGLLNWVVYAAEYRDGSAETELLDAYANGIDRNSRSRQSLRRLSAILEEDIMKLTLEGQRLGQILRAKSCSMAINSPEDATIRYSRSIHQGTGPVGELPPATLDWVPLETTLSQLETLSQLSASSGGVEDSELKK